MAGINSERRKAANSASAQGDQVETLSQILDVLPDAAVVVDKNDLVLASSSNCTALGIVSGARLIPTELRELNRQVNATGETCAEEIFIKRQNMTNVAWEVRAQVSPLNNNLRLLIVTDLSEERRLNDIRRDFVANVSHELKTPVGALGLLAEAIQAAAGDPEQANIFACRMQLETRRLSEMVSDLVELSRVQGDAPLRNAGEVDVDHLISEAIDITKVQATEKNITITVAQSKDVGSIYGDESQLITALKNLVANAIMYSDPETNIGVGARVRDGIVEISVSDQGVGIPEADQARIFERFYRVDPARSRETGGTGLGLAIVKHVASNHGGDCLVWSKPGEGSTFTLRLPQLPREQSEDKA